MSYKWNVYKLFKNGKRAKAPFHVFEYDDPESVSEHFDREVKENFTEKIRRSRMMVLRSDLPQRRPIDNSEVRNKMIKDNQRRVFHKYIKSLDSATLRQTRIVGGLIYCAQSNWRWQWAALESGTSCYIKGLSPLFSTYESAQEWMQEEIENL